MCVSQRRWTGFRGPCSPASPLILLLLLPLSFLSSTPPLAQGSIDIPKDYKVHNMSQPPVLTEMPMSYTAFSQEDIYLPCEASGNPTPTFRWVKDGEKFRSERKESGTLRGEDQEPLDSYEGYYRCYASNTLGTATTQTIQVIVEGESHTHTHTDTDTYTHRHTNADTCTHTHIHTDTHTYTHTHTGATCSALSSLVTVATVSCRQSRDVTRSRGVARRQESHPAGVQPPITLALVRAEDRFSTNSKCPPSAPQQTDSGREQLVNVVEHLAPA
ncbi:neural cell adhesion molecule L1-like [Anarrhichthys ocellatus]|uniref:neural cell adhesion molecule L1-like n=1 Tax=Anarrhichthys ocellatus TaxID=433405 RepID=UPI0012ED6E32|nr:neural cell adhesion molecule L1-like [Anarrhichthys ocellatus]